MKKILAILLGFSVVFSTCAFADEIKQVTTETIFYIKAVHTLPENALNNFSVFNTEKSSEKQEQLISFLKSCQPYNENININFFGFDATINIHSDGKINQKCSYEISANVNKIPENALSTSGLSSQDILALKPKVNCEFTQEQLDIVVNALSEGLSELNKENVTLSKTQAKKNLEAKLANNEKLKAMFKEGNVCRLTGLTDQSL